jgi:hypothetical protein
MGVEDEHENLDLGKIKMKGFELYKINLID